MRCLPPDSACAEALRGGPHWSVEAHLIDDLRMTMVALLGDGKKPPRPHPMRSVGQSRPPRDPALVNAFRRKARARKARMQQ